MEIQLTLTVNGKKRIVTTEPDRPLLDVLREELHLTGTKYGCGEGMCRACTVLLDGEPVSSCVTPVSEAAKKSIVTIEGLAHGEALHPLQQAFSEEGVVQCGYCTAGMILTASVLLKQNPHPTDAEIVDWMNGNLCRCNGYAGIIKAIHRAAGIAAGASKS